MKHIFLFALFIIFFTVSTHAQQDITVDNIVVEKAQRRLTLKNGENIIRQYKIALGKQPVGAKEKEGDNKTPEGNYVIEAHNPRSSYHLSLRISYPTPEQRKKAAENKYSPGGDIMIHGFPNWVLNKPFSLIHEHMDWTQGCIAVTDEEIEEIYQLVKDGTPISILP